ncbi:MAG TPA: hypothetical protein VM821_04705 [Abditibacteriaceae bacterium]|nr:hypothetical protein [Abditibacteriaceae bacterium]
MLYHLATSQKVLNRVLDSATKNKKARHRKHLDGGLETVRVVTRW